MTETKVFGGRYYAADGLEAMQMAQRPLSPREKVLLNLLQKHDRDLQRRVERTFKQWNLILRDYLRSETGLRLTVGDDHQAVPVRVLAGLPPPFLELFKEVDDGAWKLYFNRPLFEAADGALGMIDSNYYEFLNWEPLQPPSAEQKEIQHAKDFIDKITLNSESPSFPITQSLGDLQSRLHHLLF